MFLSITIRIVFIWYIHLINYNNYFSFRYVQTNQMLESVNSNSIKTTNKINNYQNHLNTCDK